MSDIPKPPVRKGRGALSNPAGRFETLARGSVDDGWADPDAEELPPLATTVTADPARSIITYNKSPDIDFSRSINPYRGCEHGCVYCAAGDTQVLMADGGVRALADIRPGDEIYGTVRDGWYRRYVHARVLAHWRVIKPAYRITLEDGTILMTGPDHRLLTERGWKFVTGNEQGRSRRPHLTVSNKLMGTGAFAKPVAKDRAYRRGYLAGMIRGDGTLGEYSYQRPDRLSRHHLFRLALCDMEGLQRTQLYLRQASVETQEFVFGQAVAGRRVMNAIRTQTRRNHSEIHQIIAWPNEPSREWGAGFLAGIFDAEGSYSGGVLRIHNTDPEIVGWINWALDQFAFRFAVEHRDGLERAKPMRVIRILGGLREHLRFFHGMDPAISRKRDIAGQAVKSEAQLRIVSIEPLGRAMALYDITTTTEDFIANGVVSHNCFARPSHAYLNLSPGLDFETKLYYKDNAAALFERELRKPGYVCEPITVGVNTDAYQPIERKHRVTRALLEVAQRFRQPLHLITKGAALMERDVDILGDMGRAGLVDVAISITSLRDEIKRTLEPRTASPASRLRLVRTLSDAGVPVTVMVAPVIPFVTDAEMERILEAARDAGAVGAGYVMLRLPWEVKDLFREWLDAHFPQRADHVMSLMRQLHGGAPQHAPRQAVTDPEGYNQDAPAEPSPRKPDPYARNEYYNAEWGVRGTGRGPFADLFARRFEVACRRLGLNGRRAELDTSQFCAPPAAGDQLGLEF